MSYPIEVNALAGSHARRLNRVIDHVDTHLSDDLRLDKLAQLAAFSPFHFHRLFRAWTGETLNDFVRRRRLETAGHWLRFNPCLRITEIARSCGFASAETFARAFRQHFGVTPSTWRETAASRYHREHMNGAPAARPGKVEIRHLPSREVLYWRVRGDYAVTIDGAWSRILSWVRTLGLDTQPMFGMGLDDPLITPPQLCRYDVCVALPGAWREDSRLRLSRKCIAGGWHACLQFSGRRHDVGAAWAWLIEDWLPHSGFSTTAGPFFETYPPDAPRPTGDSVWTELCMPLSQTVR